MRVSHIWTPKLNILEILKHFWPESEPCIQATTKDMDFIFPVRALPSVIHPHCIIWRHGHAQLIHSSLSNMGTISLKSGNLRVKMSYSEGGPSNGQIYKRPIDTGLNHSVSIPIWLGDLPVQLQVLTLCGSVTVGRQNWIFLTFYSIFDQHRSPVYRQPLRIWTLYFLCVPLLPSPIHTVYMKAWACTADPQ